MNIIICGLQGTGKTTLSKQISNLFGFKYINDYTICSNKIDEEKIIKFINDNDNFVLDLCYSLKPSNCLKFKNIIPYYLGFVSIDENFLFKLMKNKGENISLKQIKDNITISKKMQEECRLLKIPFYDINKERQFIIDEILLDLKNKLN